MKDLSPLVSVIVPSYNHQKYIGQCIDSIMNQEYNNFELIVIDDGSSDESRSILKNLKKKYEFRLVFQENIGLSATLNKGIKEFSSGKYITFCASDDYWLPGKLEKQVLFMEENNDIPMCYGKAYVVDENNNIIEKSTNKKNEHLRGGYIFKDILLIKFHPPVNYLFRKSIYDEVGYYREDIFTEDLYMNLLISEKHKIGYIDEYLFCYREITDYRKKRATIKSSLSHLECINGYKDSIFYNEAIRRWHYRNFIWYAPYSQYKLIALKGLFFAAQLSCNKVFLSSIFNLIFRWR